MDDESIKNLTKWSMDLYDSFEPIRQILKEHPELEEEVVTTVGQALNGVFYGNFYGPSPHGV